VHCKCTSAPYQGMRGRRCWFTLPPALYRSRAIDRIGLEQHGLYNERGGLRWQPAKGAVIEAYHSPQSGLLDRLSMHGAQTLSSQARSDAITELQPSSESRHGSAATSAQVSGPLPSRPDPARFSR